MLAVDVFRVPGFGCDAPVKRLAKLAEYDGFPIHAEKRAEDGVIGCLQCRGPALCSFKNGIPARRCDVEHCRLGDGRPLGSRRFRIQLLQDQSLPMPLEIRLQVKNTFHTNAMLPEHGVNGAREGHGCDPDRLRCTKK